MSHSDLTAIVTGGASTRGIGRATAHALAGDGWNVAILDLDEGAAKDAADEIATTHGVQAFGVACDITDETSVETALASLTASAPPIGALVNNAGITSPTRFHDVTGAIRSEGQSLAIQNRAGNRALSTGLQIGPLRCAGFRRTVRW